MLRQTCRLTNRFVQGRTARVDWAPALTTASPEVLVENLKALDSAHNRLKGIVSSVPAAVPTIDWAAFEAKGVPAETVAALKKDYEARSYPAPQISSSVAAVDKFVSNYVERMRPITESTETLLGDMANLRSKFQEDFLTLAEQGWSAEDWVRRFPGMADKIRARHLVGDIVEDEHTSQYLNIDAAALAEDVKAGKNISFDMPDDVKEYYFGGLVSENEFPNTPPDVVQRIFKPSTEGGATPRERANNAYIAEFGDLWEPVLTAVAPK
jgi:hypothetical protein